MCQKNLKPKVDFSYSMGSIPAMLRAVRPVLSEARYKELCRRVEDETEYLGQKRIIFCYVDPVVKK